MMQTIDRLISHVKLHPWWIRIPILSGMGLTLTTIILAGILMVFQVYSLSHIIPGIYINGVSVGGMQSDEVRASLTRLFNYPEQTVFTLRDGDNVWQMSASELGIHVTFDDAIDEAFVLARQDTPFANLRNQWTIWRASYDIPLHIYYDEQIARQRLDALASEVIEPVQNATITLDGLEVITTPAHSGYHIDVDMALADIHQYVQRLEGGEIQIQWIEVLPTLRDTEVTAAYIRTAISSPITLVADEVPEPWTIPVDAIAERLSIHLETRADGTHEYIVDVDMSALEESVASLADGLFLPPENGRLIFNVTTDQLEVITPAVNGRQLNIADTIKRAEEAVFTLDQRAVPMVFDDVLPDYHDEITAEELGVKELVSKSITYFTGSSQNRRQNIEMGAKRFHGIVIAPGEIFSFNEFLGDISEETGFAEGAVILGGRTVRGIGGGICQVSTTAFRVAFTGGYPIIERHSHGYRVGYYELNGAGPGLDAAIFTPTADFQFLNDTDYHIVIETDYYKWLEAVEFRFYSTHTGRTVEVSTPAILDVALPPPPVYESASDLLLGQQRYIDWEQAGGNVVVSRTIYDAKGDLIEHRDYGTYYKPWAAVIEVAPDDPRLTPPTSESSENAS